MPELTSYQKEALDINNNISLTANAGSGKTFVLSKRFVEILLIDQVDLSNIVAITFTDKAAGELNKKIAGEIEARILAEQDSIKRAKLENARSQLVSANISTIHSFCINILKEFAPEAEIDANFIPVDQQGADELIELSIDESINELIKNPAFEKDLKYLIRFFGSKKKFIDELINSVQKRRTIQKVHETIYAHDDKTICGFYGNAFNKGFHEIFSGQISRLIKALNKINAYVLSSAKTKDSASSIHELISKYNFDLSAAGQLKILSEISNLALTGAGEVRNRGYLSTGRDDFEAEISELQSVFKNLKNFFEIDYSLDSTLELIHFGKSYLKIFEHALSLYTGKKKQKGCLDFEDILLFTERVIKLPEVQQSLKEKFSYIMIDEYQDTNELQYEIFMPILDHLQSGNLFVVGDEKQSIYMFRNAELEIFNKTKNEIIAAHRTGRLLSLPHSFRMAPQLVAFTNILFANLFKDASPLFNEVEYNDLICAKSEEEKGTIELLLADPKTGIEENELTARKIIMLVNGGESLLKDIAILCRKRNAFSELEKAFVKHKIPYSIVGGKGFYQRQSVYDVYNYLAFLLNNDDDAALIGILRSPFFNLSDMQIFEISSAEGNTVFEKLKKTSFKSSVYGKIYSVLAENIKIAFSLEVYLLIRKILLESNYWSVISAKQNSSQEIANIEKLLLIARSFSQKSFKNLYDFTTSLRESIQSFEDEGQAQVIKDENTVKLMTIHQAKGLEFKTVFLYGCDESAQDNFIKSKSLEIDKDLGLLAKIPQKDNYFYKYSSAPVIALHNYIIRKKTSAENERLLYVAVTRAVNKLFICGNVKQKYGRDSFLNLFSEGLFLDLSTNEKQLSANIEFMRLEGSEYKFYEKAIDLIVPITRDVEIKGGLNIVSETFHGKINILSGRINDIPENEIISATKISMFSQCPVKYQLTYVLGYSSIHNIVKEKEIEKEYEFNANEDDELKKYAQLRGRLIHAALKDKVKAEHLNQFLAQRLFTENIFETDDTKSRLIDSIADDIKRFYQSKIYSEISTAQNSRDEFEIYCAERKNYLYGIIDRLIIDKDTLTIIDYKTDKISAGQVQQRREDYLQQLKFYAYILAGLFKNYNKYRLLMIFLELPDEVQPVEIGREELKLFGEELNSAIDKINDNNFTPNTGHCSKCHFADKGNKCVKNFS
jgi:ATP-dependent helicase/nuclease subunit A